MSETIQTELTRMLKISKPIILAGMNGVSHGQLAAAVSNAGGLGVIGGLSMSPKTLAQEIKVVKDNLIDPSLPFGVDLALPQLGGNARKTNHDYTGGKLPELIDIMVKEKISIFVCAVGVPEPWVVEKLHGANILCANMVGAPHHAEKAIKAGMDIVIAQGTEGGGHTGEVGSLCLWRQCIDVCKNHKSVLTGSPVYVVAAGGIVDGETLASALSLGCQAAWVGTRFITATESAAPPRHKETVVKAQALDTLRTLVISGRPLRTYKSEYIMDWENNRPEKIKELCDQGVVPFEHDIKESQKEGGKPFSLAKAFPLLMGQCAGSIHDMKSAKEIVDEMVDGAIRVFKQNQSLIARL